VNIKEQEGSKEAYALKDGFEPVAMIGIEKGRTTFFMVNCVNVI